MDPAVAVVVVAGLLVLVLMVLVPSYRAGRVVFRLRGPWGMGVEGAGGGPRRDGEVDARGVKGGRHVKASGRNIKARNVEAATGDVTLEATPTEVDPPKA